MKLKKTSPYVRAKSDRKRIADQELLAKTGSYVNSRETELNAKATTAKE